MSSLHRKNQINETKPILETGTKTYKEVVKAIKIIQEELEKVSTSSSRKDELRIL